jgi:hypothetical protein
VEPLSLHDRAALMGEFARLKKPATTLINAVNGALQMAPDSVPSAHGIPVPIGKLKALVKSFTHGRAIRAAAWHWLNPIRDSDLNTVDVIRRTLGLEHLSESELCRYLIHECRKVQHDSPRLQRCIEARIADLRYRTEGAGVGVSNAIAQEFSIFQRMLVTVALAAKNPDQRTIGDAHDLVENALALTAAALRNVLDDAHERERQSLFQANLMIPLRFNGDVRDAPSALGEFANYPAASAATQLWQGMTGTVSRLLVVIAETGGAGHMGFWIPDLVNGSGEFLPGAPRALALGTAQAVFNEDPPPLPLGNNVVAAKWRDHLRGQGKNSFRGSMFVSVPVLSRQDAYRVTSAAVVNVGVVGERIWPRAYSKYWLESAGQCVSPWASTVLHAAALEQRVANSTIASLPALSLAKRLPGGD